MLDSFPHFLSDRHQLCFLVLGFFGAISAAFPLAFATVYVKQRLRDHHGRGNGQAPPLEPAAEPAASAWCLCAPAAVAIASSLLLPYTVRAVIGKRAYRHAY